MSRPLAELPEALSVVERLLLESTALAVTTILKTAEDRARQAYARGSTPEISVTAERVEITRYRRSD